MSLRNRTILLAALAIVAATQAASVLALATASLGFDDARHLLNRTGFSAGRKEIELYAGMSRGDAVRALLSDARTNAQTPPPAWTAESTAIRYPQRDGGASDVARKEFLRQQVREGLELKGWWIGEMLATSSPLTEHMTLFWHNHFVSSSQKVRFAILMYRQNALLRANALGNFGTMLHAVARDPAMLIYLDAARSRKGAANENFAREVMELFTLGEGHYSEQDIKEAARAFTGWSLDRDTGQFMFQSMLHDYGTKTVLGKTGNFDGDDVLDILLAQPETAIFVTRKLWREFVSPTPDEAQVARIAKAFRDSHYDIKVAMNGILTSDAFYSAANRGVLVKSPVELVVGTLRQFDLSPPNATPFALAAATMGQNLFAPPNVKGWPGQDAWITASALLARKQFLDALFRGDAMDTRAHATAVATTMMQPKNVAASMDDGAAADAMQPDTSPERTRQLRISRAIDRGVNSVRFDATAWTTQLDTSRAHGARGAAQDSAVRLLLAVAPQASPSADANTLALVRGITLDAAYQLK